MRKRGSIVCKLRPRLPKGTTNSARKRTIVTAALQRQYLQTELILWIRLVKHFQKRTKLINCLNKERLSII
jgi:alpha-N-acetylglucosamine transferase